MVITDMLISITIIIISFIVSIALFYLTSEQTKVERKSQAEEAISQVINFMLFVFLSKIILNFFTFIQQPLSVLSYPSDSSSFYLAYVLTLLIFTVQVKKKNIKINVFITSFILILIIASIIYEFINFIWNDSVYSFSYLLLLCILLGEYYVIENRFNTSKLMLIMTMSWIIGILVLILLQPMVSVFNYVIHPYFLLIFLITNVLLIFYVIRPKEIS